MDYYYYWVVPIENLRQSNNELSSWFQIIAKNSNNTHVVGDKAVFHPFHNFLRI